LRFGGISCARACSPRGREVRTGPETQLLHHSDQGSPYARAARRPPVGGAPDRPPERWVMQSVGTDSEDLYDRQELGRTARGDTALDIAAFGLRASG